jgi:hypothetical protein
MDDFENEALRRGVERRGELYVTKQQEGDEAS